MKACNEKSCQGRALNSALVLEKPIFTPDGGGGRTVSWQFVSKIWGSIETRSMKEVERDGGKVMGGTYDIYIRGRVELDSTMRFVHGTQHYYITAFGYGKDMPQAARAARHDKTLILCHCESFERRGL